MKWFTDLSIRTKLVIGFGLMWLLLATLGLFSYLSIIGIARSERDLHGVHVKDALILTTVRSHLNHNRTEMLAMILTPDKPGRDALQQSVMARQEQIDALMKDLLIDDHDPLGLAMENVNKAGTQTAASTTQVESAARNLHELGLKLKGLVEQFKG